MSESDNDNAAAIDKVVGAFRAQREQGKSTAAESDEAAAPADQVEPTRTPTEVEKLEDEPEPAGGGTSEAPTKAFKIPAEVAAAAAAAAAARTTDVASTADIVEESVVGDPLQGEAFADAPGADADDLDKAILVEQSIALAEEKSSDDAAGADAATEQISTEAVTAQLADASSEAATTEMKVPAGVSAAAGAAAAAAAAAAATTTGPTPTAEKPAPQVVAPATNAAEAKSKGGRGKWIAIALAAVVLLAVIGIGLWYALVANSPENDAADVAKDFQNAMTDGDLDDLRDLTCGAEKAFYTSVSEEQFQKAYQAQKATNQMMTFDDVNAVQINGDTALVGVDMYPVNNPSKKLPAQITLHKVDGDWKVCTKP
ncbi:DUF4878 domain-containing protein [Gordonia sp. (in: high G+C Gram-positive bacteria)]|uniref:Rv0361 family membrane protein n=1 Tax=Gordonia sp. (in: high G+C Gram-positive bacteria) TaxID=84139 RepID=UPI003C711617